MDVQGECFAVQAIFADRGAFGVDVAPRHNVHMCFVHAPPICAL